MGELYTHAKGLIKAYEPMTNSKRDNDMIKRLAGCLNNLRESDGLVPQRKVVHQLDYLFETWLEFLQRDDMVFF